MASTLSTSQKPEEALQIGHLSDLHGLIVEHLEEVLVAGQTSSWLKRWRKKLIKLLIKELRNVTDEKPTSRLSDFYTSFQNRGGVAGPGAEESQQLRHSFRRSSGKTAIDSFDSPPKQSGDESDKQIRRLSSSSETVGTNQTKQTNQSKDSTISFNISGTSSGGGDISVDGGLSDDISDDYPKPIAPPLAKTTKGASNASVNLEKCQYDERLRQLRTLVHEMKGQAASRTESEAMASLIQSDLFPRTPSVTSASLPSRPPLMPGTPQSSERSMKSSLSQVHSRRNEGSNRGRRRAVKGLVEGEPSLTSFVMTPPDSIRCSLEWIMKHWNPVRVNTCCPFHAFIAIANLCIHHMGKEECMPLWSPITGWQCDECSCLNHEESKTCDLCLTIRREQTVSTGDSISNTGTTVTTISGSSS